MTRRPLVTIAVALALATLAATGRAQEPPKQEGAKPPEAVTSRPKKVPVMLRVQITIARYQAERKLASAPYTVLLTTDDRRVRLRMGVEVPIPVTSFSKADDAKSSAVTSFQYRNVGTNIDCWAEDRSGDGLFQVVEPEKRRIPFVFASPATLLRTSSMSRSLTRASTSCSWNGLET